MISLLPVAVNNLFAAYVFVFAVTALVCVWSASRARRINDADTRRGLVALLVTSGPWAAAHVGYLVVPTPDLKIALYQLGLIVGISTVGPWLSFCSGQHDRVYTST